VEEPDIETLRTKREDESMKASWMQAQAVLQVLHCEESGQDLVEYAMVMVIIGLAATAAMGTVASQINTVFMNLANKISRQGS
jgi:Flp pilus assembly pilin Flp